MLRRTRCGLVVVWLSCSFMALAGPLTLPFGNTSFPLWQGYYYDTGAFHGAIDYGMPIGTPILAADSGYAWKWTDDIYSSYSWGHYVAIYHPSCACYTLYAHLSSQEAFIPRVFKNTHGGGAYAYVQRGQVIGYSGNTGTSDPHLHFEVSKNGINGAAGAYRVDPYGLEKTHWYYPGCGNNTKPYYWSTCAPVAPANQPTCNSPGSYVDISNAGDFNKDRKFEFVRFYKGPGRWDVALSTGSQFLPLKKWFCGLGIGSVAQLVGDVNGDGRDDAVILDKNTNGTVYVALSNGSGFNNFYQAGTNLMRNMANRWLEDINGDGKDDLVGFANDRWYIALSNGFTFGPQKYVRYVTSGSTKRMVADINGDSRADIVTYYSWGAWWVALGRSDGTVSGWSQWAAGHGKGASNWFLADINGDKKADAVCFWNRVGSWQGRIIVWNSDGSRFVPNNAFRAIGHGTDSQKQMFADYTGDGKADFGFWYPSGGWYVSKSDGWGFLPPQRW